jgi:hypothetical protein
MLAHHGQTIDLTSGFVFDFNFLNPTWFLMTRRMRFITPTIFFAVNDNPVTKEKRWGMLVDINQLSESDIDNMVNACQEENGWGNETHSTGHTRKTIQTYAYFLMAS